MIIQLAVYTIENGVKKYLSNNTVDDDQPQQFVWKDHGPDIDDDIMTWDNTSEIEIWLNSNVFQRTAGKMGIDTLIRKFG